MPHPPHRFVNLDGAAAFLGMTPKAVSKRVERRSIPFRKAGKRLIFDLVELEDWVSHLPGITAEEALSRVVPGEE